MHNQYTLFLFRRDLDERLTKLYSQILNLLSMFGTRDDGELHFTVRRTRPNVSSLRGSRYFTDNTRPGGICKN